MGRDALFDGINLPRGHLGMETQRQWSDLAIKRTTPVLLSLFSIVILLAMRLQQDDSIPVQPTAWYRKTEPTFSDCMLLVRRHLWKAVFCELYAKARDGTISLRNLRSPLSVGIAFGRLAASVAKVQ